MQDFTCQAVETKLHRYFVDKRLGKMVFLLTPDNVNDGWEATELAGFINNLVGRMCWSQLSDEAVEALPTEEKSA
jgi:hypothetical protein